MIARERQRLVIGAVIAWLGAGIGASAQAATAGSPGALLQRTAGGHVLAFERGGVTASNGRYALRVEFVGASGAGPAGDDAGDPGGDPAPLRRVRYADVWPGITLEYEAVAGALARSTYRLAPGVDPRAIRLRYNAPVQLDAGGTLSVTYPTGRLIETAPVAWQERDGERRAVAVAFERRAEREIGFAVGAHDPALPLVIDPTLIWNTFLGTSGGDSGNAIALDAGGNVYVAGTTSGNLGGNPNSGSLDAFAAKLDSSGALLWSRLLGGAAPDEGLGIAVDGVGDVFVVGTSSAAWGTPVRAYSGSSDAFAAKLTAAGALSWNTFLGGTGLDSGVAVTPDGSGGAYVAGESSATWGTPVRGYGGGSDAFAVRLNAGGTVSWSTFLGGSGSEGGRAIAADIANGIVWVVGISSASWGTPVNAYTGGSDGFAARLTVNGALIWNTFLGGIGNDVAPAVAADGSANVYVAGSSNGSWGTPVRAYSGSWDAFAAKLTPAGALVWNTFLGGSFFSMFSGDLGRAIALDGAGNVYVAGESLSSWGTPVRPFNGGIDAFAAELTPAGALIWNTFLGGAEADQGYAIAVDGSGRGHIAGSSDATWGAPLEGHSGGFDAFVAQLAAEPPTPTPTPTATIPTPTASHTATPTDTETPADTPTASPTATVTDTGTPTETATPAATPTPTSASCPPAPAGSCLAPGKGKLILKNHSDDAKDKLIWKFNKGPALTQNDFGLPTGTTGYALCVYDDGALVLQAQVGPSALLWKPVAVTKGWKYQEPGGMQDGVTKVKLLGGAAGASKILFKAKGVNVPLPPPVGVKEFFSAMVEVRAQLHASGGACFETAFTPAQVIKNTARLLKAKF
jgi:hypothetical protein